MPLNKLAPWDARVRLHQAQQAATAAPKPPRAIDPTTDAPFNRPTHLQSLSFRLMDRLLPFLSSWIVRYLTAAFTTFGLLWGASGEQSATAANWIGGAIVWLLLAALRQIKLWVLRRAGKPVKVDAAKVLLLALCFGSLTFLPSCRHVGRGMVYAGAATVEAGTRPDAWRRQLRSPVAQVAMAPLTFTAGALGAVLGVPLFFAGVAISGGDGF